MEHINLPVSVERTESMTDLIDAKGNTVIWQGSSFPEMDEIALALNQYDRLTAERDALVKAGGLAQTALDNFAERDPTLKKSFSWILAMDRLRAALALVEGEVVE